MRDESNEIVVSNKHYTIYKQNRIEVYNHILANRLNRILGTYKDYIFKKGIDEPVFNFSSQERSNIIANLGGLK